MAPNDLACNPPPLSSFSLFPATYEQVIESRNRSAVAWSRERTLEQYIGRDAIMDEHEHAAKDRLITWVLAPRDEPTTLDFMCSCETFRRDSIAVHRSTQDGSVVAEEVVGYAIASVFTPEGKRRNGYAHHMMRLLHWVLAPQSVLSAKFPAEWGEAPKAAPSTGNAKFSILYSDIGPTFYSTCGPDVAPFNGWQVTRAIHTEWKIRFEDRSEDGTASEAATLAGWRWLALEDIQAIYDKDTQLIRQEVAENIPTGTAFAFLPDKGVGLFNINRTMLFPGNSTTPYLPSERWGVIQEDLPQSPLQFATWIPDTRGNLTVLLVTRLRVNPSTFAALFQKLKEAARHMSAATVEIWDVPANLVEVAESYGGVPIHRNDHLPSFKWYGKEASSEVHWLHNEKFGWC